MSIEQRHGLYLTSLVLGTCVLVLTTIGLLAFLYSFKRNDHWRRKLAEIIGIRGPPTECSQVMPLITSPSTKATRPLLESARRTHFESVTNRRQAHQRIFVATQFNIVMHRRCHRSREFGHHDRTSNSGLSTKCGFLSHAPHFSRTWKIIYVIGID